MTEQKRPIKSDDFMHIAVHSDPQITPNGDGFSFVTTQINKHKEYESHLYFQYFDEENAVKWTFGNEKNSNPRFSPDGSKVIFTSTRTGISQLWLINTAGGEAQQLTSFKYGATNPHWSPDGKSIIFSASLYRGDDVTNQAEQTKEEGKKEQAKKAMEPTVISKLKHKSDAGGFRDGKYSQLILFNMENETFTKLTTMEADHSYQDISPDGNLLLFSANLNDQADYELTNDLYLLNLTTKERTKLTDRNGSYGNARFSPTGTRIACFGHEHEYSGATLNELFLFNIETAERTCLSTDWDMQLGDLMIGDMRLGQTETGPIWSKDEQSLYFIATNSGATALYEVNMAKQLRAVYEDNNHVFGFAYHPETERFVIGVSSPTDPGDFYLIERDTPLRQLTKTNTAFIEETFLAAPEEVIVTAEDGWNIQGWLLKPYGFIEGKKYPFILEIHGGPHAMYGQTFFHELQLLAAKGYVVLYMNPRGSHGYGQEFVDAVRTDYGGKDYTDLMTAVDHVLEQYDFIDENRLGVTGGSYGGFMTNWIVGHTNRFKAAVTQRCISNWLSFYGVSDIGYFFTKWELGINLLEDPKKLWDFSPLKYVKNVETPLLILHGEQDLRCPIEQGEQLFIALKHLRKEVEFVRFPGANHELSRSGKPTLRLARLEHICRWFEQYL